MFLGRIDIISDSNVVIFPFYVCCCCLTQLGGPRTHSCCTYNIYTQQQYPFRARRDKMRGKNVILMMRGKNVILIPPYILRIRSCHFNSTEVLIQLKDYTIRTISDFYIEEWLIGFGYIIFVLVRESKLLATTQSILWCPMESWIGILRHTCV